MPESLQMQGLEPTQPTRAFTWATVENSDINPMSCEQRFSTNLDHDEQTNNRPKTYFSG